MTPTLRRAKAARRRDQDQGFHCRLPFLGAVFCLRKRRDVIAGIGPDVCRPVTSHVGPSAFFVARFTFRRSNGCRR